MNLKSINLFSISNAPNFKATKTEIQFPLGKGADVVAYKCDEQPGTGSNRKSYKNYALIEKRPDDPKIKRYRGKDYLVIDGKVICPDEKFVLCKIDDSGKRDFIAAKFRWIGRSHKHTDTPKKIEYDIVYDTTGTKSVRLEYIDHSAGEFIGSNFNAANMRGEPQVEFYNKESFNEKMAELKRESEQRVKDINQKYNDEIQRINQAKADEISAERDVFEGFVSVEQSINGQL